MLYIDCTKTIASARHSLSTSLGKWGAFDLYILIFIKMLYIDVILLCIIQKQLEALRHSLSMSLGKWDVFDFHILMMLDSPAVSPHWVSAK